MKTVLGFITRAGYITNTPGQVAKFYELSPMGLTYSRNRGEYSSNTYIGDVLHTFKTYDDQTHSSFELTPAEVSEILLVNKRVLDYLQAATYPYDTEDFRNTIMAGMAGAILDFDFGVFETGGFLVLPEWISWKKPDGSGMTVKVWLNAQAFEEQYSEYEIVVVPPIDDMNRFFAVYGAVAEEVRQMDAVKVLEKTQVMKHGLPDSITRILKTTLINSNNPTQSTAVYWGVAIYGKAGDHIDAIKDAVIDYVLSNSDRDQAEWEVVMPDLFQRTEFLIQPRWDLLSIHNLTVAAALYRSIVNPNECLEKAREVWQEQAPAYVNGHLELLPFDYKAIMVMSLPGQTNVEGKKTLQSLFADYLPVSTGSMDFSRMSVSTQNWVLMMVGLIVAAETATAISPLPADLRRTIRHGKRYISKVYQDVNYLVAMRLSA